MRNVWFVLKFILACILGFVLQLTLHEMGHAVFALITGNEVVNVSLGIVSYAVVNVLNEWSIPVISVGSFVFPIVVCAFLALFRSEFVRCLSAVILTITTIQLAINAVAILSVKDVSRLQTYDLGVCVASANWNNVILSVVSIITVITLIVWVISNLKKIVDEV